MSPTAALSAPAASCPLLPAGKAPYKRHQNIFLNCLFAVWLKTDAQPLRLRCHTASCHSICHKQAGHHFAVPPGHKLELTDMKQTQIWLGNQWISQHTTALCRLWALMTECRNKSCERRQKNVSGSCCIVCFALLFLPFYVVKVTFRWARLLWSCNQWNNQYLF